jgi:hypothetical protein
MEKLEIRRLSFFSVFKILFIGLLLPLFVFGLVCGLAAMGGANTVSINGQPIYGIQGLLGGLAIGVFLPLFFAFLFSILVGVGLWVYSKFKTMHIAFRPK